MSKFTIDIDYELADKITAQSLLETYQNFKDRIGEIEAGGRPAIFEWEDIEHDKAEIQKRIDALELLLDWYCTPDQLKEMGLKDDD
jgi:hypothetical protein